MNINTGIGKVKPVWQEDQPLTKAGLNMPVYALKERSSPHGAIVTPESAAYNNQQVIDAFAKRQQGIPLNNFYRESTELERYRGAAPYSAGTSEDPNADLHDSNIRSQNRNALGGLDNVPRWLPPQAMTELQAFNAYMDETGRRDEISLNEFKRHNAPEDAANLSKLDAAKEEVRDPVAFKEAQQAYENYLKGKTAIPAMLPDLESQKGLNDTYREIKNFKNKMADLGIPNITNPLEKRGKDIYGEYREGAMKVSSIRGLSEWNENGIISMVNDLTADALERQSTLTAKIDPNSIDPNLSKRTVWDRIKEDYGLYGETEAAAPSVFVLNYLTLMDAWRMMQYDAQALGAMFNIDPSVLLGEQEEVDVAALFSGASAESLNVTPETLEEGLKFDPNKSQEVFRNAVKNRNVQPIVTGIFSTWDRLNRDIFGRKGTASAEPSADLISAASMFDYFGSKMYNQWGTTNSMYAAPVINENFDIGNLSQTQLATAFNPSLRTKMYSGTIASNFPKGVDFQSIIGNWPQMLRKGHNEGKGTIANSGTMLLGGVPIRVSKYLAWITQQMEEQLVKEDPKLESFQGLDHPFAKTFGGFSRADYDQYQFRDAESKREGTNELQRMGAEEQIGNQRRIHQDRLNSYIDRLKIQDERDVWWFIDWYNSKAAGRFYPSDLNAIGDKSILRNMLQIGKPIPVNLKDTEINNPKGIRGLTWKVFDPSNSKKLKGASWGANITNNLVNLDSSKRQMLTFYYALGKLAENLDFGKRIKNVQNKDSRIEYIELGLASLDKMAELGEQMNNYLVEGKLPDAVVSKKVAAFDLAQQEKESEGNILNQVMSRMKGQLKDSPDFMRNISKAFPGRDIGTDPRGTPPDARQQELFPTYQERVAQELDGLGPDLIKLFKKGEYGFNHSMVRDAFRLKKVLANERYLSQEPSETPSNFKFEAYFGEDAKQSNVSIIATALIGDFGIGALTGILPDKKEGLRNPVTDEIPDDFRDFLVSNLEELTIKTLNDESGNDLKKGTALATYFNSVMNRRDIDGTKVIARGLQIGGVYGKWPGFMYTEAAKMLAETPKEAKILYASPEYQITGSNQPSRINHDLLKRDLSQVYLTLANVNMAALMDYQSLMKSIGRGMFILDAPTEIPNILGNDTIQLSYEDSYQMHSKDVMTGKMEALVSQVGRLAIPTYTKQTTAMAIAPATTKLDVKRARLKQLADAGIDVSTEEGRKQAQKVIPELLTTELTENVSIEPIVDEEGRPVLSAEGVPLTKVVADRIGEIGSQLIRGTPVTPVQNIDAMILAMTIIEGNSRKWKKVKSKLEKIKDPIKRQEALTNSIDTALLAIYPVHDQIMGNMDSLLIWNSIYNDEMPHLIQKFGKTFMERMYNNFIHKSVVPIIQAPDNERFGIGTSRGYSTIEGEEGITALNLPIIHYFDQIYARTMESDVPFIQPEQAKRRRINRDNSISDMTNEEWYNKTKADQMKFLAIATNHGYRDPNSTEPRDHYSISSYDMKALLVLFLEREGLLSPKLINAIEAATRQLHKGSGKKGLKNVSQITSDLMDIKGLRKERSEEKAFLNYATRKYKNLQKFLNRNKMAAPHFHNQQSHNEHMG